jgi:hypothetical protein
VLLRKTIAAAPTKKEWWVIKKLLSDMKNKRRDLLVLLNNEHRSQEAIDHEVEWLHDVLYHVEELENFCKAHELIDLNRYRIVTRTGLVKKAVLRKDFKAFEFISNKN